jgi:UDP-N-acetylglucosamine 2-epimerase
LHFFRNFSVEDYACLIANCKCIVGNSSSGIREGAFLGTPVVNIGTRQNKRERSRNVVDSTYNADDIYAATLKQLEHGRYEKDPVFGNGTSGKQIAELLATVEVSIQKSITY